MRSDVIAVIDTEALAHNYRVLRAKCAPGVRFCAPLKADAYGHGLSIVGRTLHKAGADYGAVATLMEAIELRHIGWTAPILLLGNVLAVAHEAERRERLDAIVHHRLTVTIVDPATVPLLASAATNGEPLPVHVKIDTGMGRMGVVPQLAGELVTTVLAEPRLRLCGVYSHFATADFEQLDLARTQLDAFRSILDHLGGQLPDGVIRHLSNSAATICMPQAHFDMVRPGLALYGYSPADHLVESIELRPALRLVSHLTAVKMLPPGHCVGYGCTFKTRRPTRLGIVPAGYHDGFIRLLSNNAIVSTAAGDAPVIGRISMDQLALDLTDLPPQPIGTEICLIDNRPGRPNSVVEIARRIGTIPYEVTCLLGSRIDRIEAARYGKSATMAAS